MLFSQKEDKKGFVIEFLAVNLSHIGLDSEQTET